jgi:hypothetical protein
MLVKLDLVDDTVAVIACLQCAYLHPLVPPGPSVFVVCHHLGADGVPGLYGGCAIRVQLRLGRCHVSLPTKYTPKVTRDTSQMPPLILTARSTAAHSNVLSQVVHVYLFKGSSARCVILSCSLRNAGPHSFAFLPLVLGCLILCMLTCG